MNNIVADHIILYPTFPAIYIALKKTNKYIYIYAFQVVSQHLEGVCGSVFRPANAHGSWPAASDALIYQVAVYHARLRRLGRQIHEARGEGRLKPKLVNMFLMIDGCLVKGQ